MVKSCNNISALRQAIIHPEAVELRRKQVDIISRMSNVYRSMYSGISLVQVHGHQNRGSLASTLTPLAYLNVILDALAEHIMAAFLLSSATRNTIAIVLSERHRIQSVSIHGALFHSNIAHYIALEISKRLLIQHWYYCNLTHTADQN